MFLSRSILLHSHTTNAFVYKWWSMITFTLPFSMWCYNLHIALSDWIMQLTALLIYLSFGKCKIKCQSREWYWSFSGKLEFWDINNLNNLNKWTICPDGNLNKTVYITPTTPCKSILLMHWSILHIYICISVILHTLSCNVTWQLWRIKMIDYTVHGLLLDLL